MSDTRGKSDFSRERNAPYEITIRYSPRAALPEQLESKAKELDITVEQLVKRFICTGMQEFSTDSGPAILGETLEDFLVKNGVIKEQ
jgi:hypothetical protein